MPEPFLEFKFDKDINKEIKDYLKRKERVIGSKLRTKLKESMEFLKDRMAAYAPHNTGELREIIQTLPVSGLSTVTSSFSFTNNGKINISLILSRKRDRRILWADRGTGLYGPYKTRIVPTSSKFLYFEINGKLIRVRSIKGQKGTKFISRAISGSKLIIISKIRSGLRD